MYKNLNITLIFFYLLPISSYGATLENIFTTIYTKWLWAGKESVSGSGSDFHNTKNIRKQLPAILKQLKTKKLLDAPCGDFWWMKELDLSFLQTYIGADIVRPLIKKLNSQYRNNYRRFIHVNLMHDLLPKVDTILCRDLFLHLTYDQIFTVLKNFKKTGAKYLIASTYVKEQKNKNIGTVSARSRPINLEKAPFNFPKPLVLLDEKHTDKWLGVWHLSSILTN